MFVFITILIFERKGFKMAPKDFENTLKIMRFSLLLSGIKTSPNSWNYAIELFVNNYLYYINLLTLYSVIIGEITWLIKGVEIGRSFVELSLPLPLITISVLGTVKSFNLYLKRDIVCEIIDTLILIHPEENEIEEDKIRNESVRVLSRMINLLMVVSWPVLVMFCLSPLIVMGIEYLTKGETGILYPFSVEYWFDVHNTMMWPILYLHQVLATIIVCMNLIGSEILFYVICANIEMHFRILCHRYEGLQLISSRQLKEDLRGNVLKHQQLIYLVDQAETLFSKPALFQIVTSSVLICLSAFNISVTDDVKTMFAFTTFLSLNLSQVSLLCFFGDKLIASSAEVSVSVFRCPWWQFDMRTKKAVLIVMMRARKPCKLTAANFADLNLRAFTTILSRAWSYFALLKTVYN